MALFSKPKQPKPLTPAFCDRCGLRPGRACVAFHTTWKPERDGLSRLLPLLEQQLSPFGATPPWAKLFTMSRAARQTRHARVADFRWLVDRYDPAAKFRNEFLGRNIYGG